MKLFFTLILSLLIVVPVHAEISYGESVATYSKLQDGTLDLNINSVITKDPWMDIRAYGAIADGNGTGGGTNNTTAFNNAYTAVNVQGGGILYIPFTGTGIYRVDGEISGKANVELRIASGVKIDFTNKTTGKGLNLSGTVGDEINLGANATRGDTTIVTAAAHGLAVGDWFLLMSQRASLHDDAGDWRLGITTGGTVMPFFAEPCQVVTVTSATEVEVATPLIFPDYRTDRTQETFSSSRVSTIKKINFIEGVKVIGGTFITRGVGDTDPTNAIQVWWAKEPYIETAFDLGGNPGTGLKMTSCLRGKAKVSASHTPDWVLGGVDHSRFNSFKDIGSWYSDWEYADRNGSQGLDITYTSGAVPYHPSIFPHIKATSYDSHEVGLTFHSGAYGGIVDNPRVFNAKLGGIYNRSRQVAINNPYISGQTTGSAGEAGIVMEGWVADSSVTGGYIEGVRHGVYGQRSSSEGTGPAAQNYSIDGTTFNRVEYGVRLQTDSVTPLANADDSGISIKNISVRNFTGSGAVTIESYVNGVEIDGLDVNGAVGGSTQRGVYVRSDCINTNIKNVSGRGLKTGDYLVNVLGLTDTTTFPAATYPTNRLKLESDSITLLGDGTASSLTLTVPGGYYRRATADFTLAYFDANKTVSIFTSGTIDITVPPNSDVSYPIDTKITFRQEGTGQGAIVAGAGVTVNSRSGLKTAGQYAVITLQKTSTDVWYLSGDTAP